jgi:hypothetical protein
MYISKFNIDHMYSKGKEEKNEKTRISLQNDQNREAENLINTDKCTPRNGSDVLQGKNGLGPNPRKCLPQSVRFIKECPPFVGEDLDNPGEIRTYGPYQVNDVIALPKLNANVCVMKGLALESIRR